MRKSKVDAGKPIKQQPSGPAPVTTPQNKPGGNLNNQRLLIIGLIVVCVIIAAVFIFMPGIFQFPSLEPGPGNESGPGTGPGETPTPAKPITISASVPSGTHSVGDTIVIDINVADSEDLFGYQFDLNWDDSVLKYQDLEDGDFLKKDGVPLGSAGPFNSTGKVTYAVTRMQGGGSGVEGDGTITKITFKAVGSGTSQFTFTGVKLSDSKIVNIESIISNSQIVIV